MNKPEMVSDLHNRQVCLQQRVVVDSSGLESTIMTTNSRRRFTSLLPAVFNRFGSATEPQAPDADDDVILTVVETPEGAVAGHAPVDLYQALTDAIQESKAPNTRASYLSQWRLWTNFAHSIGASHLPAHPEAIALYITERARSGCKLNTIRASLTAISAAHALVGLNNPCVNQGVKDTLRGLGRQYGSAERQAAALDGGALAAIKATARIPRVGRRGLMETSEYAETRGNVDIALCCLLSDAGLRRSECAALTWDDIAIGSDGTGIVTIWRSKTDQMGESAVVAITRGAVDALMDIRPAAAGPGRSVFNMSPSTIHRRVKAAARQAGLGDGFSGHSGRVGVAIRMTEGRAPMSTIMTHGRWQDARLVGRYARNLSAAEALRYL